MATLSCAVGSLYLVALGATICLFVPVGAVPTKGSSLQRIYDDSPQVVASKSDIGEARIVGGSPAGRGKYPYVVPLFNSIDPSDVLPVCSGSLITPSVVLTAAHCIFNIRSAMVGRYDFSVLEEGVQTYTNIQRRFHPGFNANTFDFDYALIKLDRPQPDAKLVHLRRTPEIPSEMTIMGWGATSFEGQQQPNVMLEANVTRFDSDQCAFNYDPEQVTENMFCANELNRDACQGDSGGPIIIRGHNVQVGLVSWGNGCADFVFPGVYARTDSGFEWIQSTVCGDLSPEDCVNDKLPVVDSEGRARGLTCQDTDGNFLGLGKKL